MPGHTHETACSGSCVLRQLLQLGANPDPKGFQVTPLQIAVFCRDLAGVRTLLEAGADPNNTGDEQGIKWHAETSVLGPYCRLHGLAPLYILRHLKAYRYFEDGMTTEEIDEMNGATTIDIERLLLDYGASTVVSGNVGRKIKS
jgi:ankyrin repeat protein